MPFLHWLYLRLKFKYKEEADILSQYEKLLTDTRLIKKSIPINFIDKICKEHFIDFDLEKIPDLNMGYTEEERSKIRNFAIDLLNKTLLTGEETLINK
jgi:hypothetical protein